MKILKRSVLCIAGLFMAVGILLPTLLQARIVQFDRYSGGYSLSAGTNNDYCWIQTTDQMFGCEHAE